MADQILERNTGRPHHESGQIGDWLNSLSDRDYWDAHALFHADPISQGKTFDQHIHDADEEFHVQVIYDEINARCRKHYLLNRMLFSLSDAGEGDSTNVAPLLEFETRNAPSIDSVLLDDVWYRSPSPRRGDRAESIDSRERHTSRSEDEGSDEHKRQKRTSTSAALMREGFETDALDDETLARLLENPPIEMLEQAAPMPGTLDDEAVERFLAKQQEEIWDGGWGELVKEAPWADHLEDEDFEKFLAREQEKVFSGETEAFPVVQRHPDALIDDDLAKSILSLGFHQRPLVQPERGDLSRSRPTNSKTRGRSSGYSARPAPSTLPGDLAPDYLPETAADRSRAFEEAMTPEPLSNAERLYWEQMEIRRRRQNAIQRRRDAEQEVERIKEAESAKEGKQPERYYE